MHANPQILTIYQRFDNYYASESTSFGILLEWGSVDRQATVAMTSREYGALLYDPTNRLWAAKEGHRAVELSQRVRALWPPLPTPAQPLHPLPSMCGPTRQSFCIPLRPTVVTFVRACRRPSSPARSVRQVWPALGKRGKMHHFPGPLPARELFGTRRGQTGGTWREARSRCAAES